MTFAGLRRWRDALIENNALQESRYRCSLGSLANEVADQDWPRCPGGSGRCAIPTSAQAGQMPG